MAVLLASGGFDSTVLGKILQDAPHVYGVSPKEPFKALFLDIGQRSADACWKVVRAHFGKKASIRLELPLFKGLSLGSHEEGYTAKTFKGDNPFNESGAGLDLYGSKDYSYVPCRNTIFQAYSVMLAHTLNVKEVYVGYQFEQDEWERFWTEGNPISDIDAEFVSSFNNLLLSGGYSLPGEMRVRAPFLESKMDKQAIKALAASLNLKIKNTYSCEYYPPCGECWQCVKVASL